MFENRRLFLNDGKKRVLFFDYFSVFGGNNRHFGRFYEENSFFLVQFVLLPDGGTLFYATPDRNAVRGTAKRIQADLTYPSLA